MPIDAHLLIRKTAEAIQSGIKPYKLIDNPQKILSGKTKSVLLNKLDKGVIIYESQLKMLQENGFKINEEEIVWKSKYNNKLRYFVYDKRDDQVLLDAVKAELIPDYIIYDVPIEEWSWIVNFMKKQMGGSEYIEMLL